MRKSNTQGATNTKNEKEFVEHGDDIKDVMKFVS